MKVIPSQLSILFPRLHFLHNARCRTLWKYIVWETATEVCIRQRGRWRHGPKWKIFSLLAENLMRIRCFVLLTCFANVAVDKIVVGWYCSMFETDLPFIFGGKRLTEDRKEKNFTLDLIEVWTWNWSNKWIAEWNLEAQLGWLNHQRLFEWRPLTSCQTNCRSLSCWDFISNFLDQHLEIFFKSSIFVHLNEAKN